MAHLSDTQDRTAKTPVEWLGVGSAVASLVNRWADRIDVIGFVGAGAGEGSPACFKPRIAEIELNRVAAFGADATPELVGDLREKGTQEAWPVATGVLLHEAGHAAFSLWPLEEMHGLKDRRLAAIIENLEETRIERAIALRHPSMKHFLRASAMQLVVTDAHNTENSSELSAALFALLVLGRVTAGIITEDDARDVRVVIEKILGPDVVAKMEPLWVAAQNLTEHASCDKLFDYGRQILELLIAEEKIPEKEETTTITVTVTPSDGDGDGDGDGSASGGTLQELLEAAAAAGAGAQVDVIVQIADEQLAEAAAAAAAESAKGAAEARRNRDTAQDVFGRSTGPSSRDATSSALVNHRPPSAAERIAAVKIGDMLDRARYQERLVTPTSTQLPPGRLRSRAMVQRAAEQSRGAMATAEPWRGRRRRHVDDPNLTLGVMCDISGSRYRAMEPTATAAWVFSEAGKRIQARTAMVYYGDSVFPVLKPGQHLDEVNVYSAPDSTEKFTRAFTALDGALELLRGSGARLLVIISDMYYTQHEHEYALSVMPRLIRAGVGVMILPLSSERNHRIREYEKIAGLEIIYEDLSPTQVVTTIGVAARRAIEHAASQIAR